MKYQVKTSTPANNLGDLIVAINALELTIEGTAFRFIDLMPTFDRISATAIDEYSVMFYIESQYKIQNVSNGWEVAVITDKGNVALNQFLTASVAQFTKGVLYLVKGTQAFSLQSIVNPMAIVVPYVPEKSDSIVIQSNTVPYFAYEATVPQGLNSVNAIQINVIPAMIQSNLGLKSQSAAMKGASVMSVIQSK